MSAYEHPDRCIGCAYVDDLVEGVRCLVHGPWRSEDERVEAGTAIVFEPRDLPVPEVRS